ncbi:DUF3892 domain-containing protein [Pseudomonas protegens]|uniref:DUF3892 domain-containing protein n=1 Tax=Pseudomonas protegens TaxID=380021 RepID=UPI0034D69C06
MADFCITAVKYNKAREHIVRVHVREEKHVVDEKGRSKIVLGPYRVVSRAFVADLIRLGKATFQTRTLNAKGTWDKGSEVSVIEERFLTTQPNHKKRDNLGELPEF